MKKLPIGISNLREIIQEGYAYVDKSELVYQLAESGKYYFLSRPRRFGKSLFIDTLKEAFEGTGTCSGSCGSMTTGTGRKNIP